VALPHLTGKGGGAMGWGGERGAKARQRKVDVGDGVAVGGG
jgi:hypothetical protein